MQLNHKPLIGWLYRPIFEFGPGQNSISVSPTFSLRFSHPDPIKTENAFAAFYLIFRFQQQQQHFISPHNVQEIKIYNNSTDDWAF